MPEDDENYLGNGDCSEQFGKDSNSQADNENAPDTASEQQAEESRKENKDIAIKDFDPEDIEGIVEASSEAMQVKEEEKADISSQVSKIPDLLHQYHKEHISTANNDLAITYNVGEKIIDNFSRNYKGESLKDSNIKGILMNANGVDIPVFIDKTKKRLFDEKLLEVISKTIAKSQKKGESTPEVYTTKEYGKVAVVPFHVEPGKYSAIAVAGINAGFFDKKDVLSDMEKAVRSENIGQKAKITSGMKFSEDVDLEESVKKKYRAMDKILMNELSSQKSQDRRFEEEIKTLQDVAHVERVKIGVINNNIITYRRITYNPKSKKYELRRFDVNSKEFGGIDAQGFIRDTDLFENEVYSPLLNEIFSGDQDRVANPTTTHSLMSIMGRDQDKTRIIINAENKEGFYTPVFAKIEGNYYQIDLDKDFFEDRMGKFSETINKLHKNVFRRVREKQVKGSKITVDEGITYQLESFELKADDTVVKKGVFPHHDKEIKLSNIEFCYGMLDPLELTSKKKQFRGKFTENDADFIRDLANNHAKVIRTKDYEARLREVDRTHGRQQKKGLISTYDLGKFTESSKFLNLKDPDKGDAKQTEILSNAYITRYLEGVLGEIVKETDVLLIKADEGDNAFIAAYADSDKVERTLRRALFDKEKKEQIGKNCAIINGTPVLRADRAELAGDKSVGYKGRLLDDETLVDLVEQRTKGIEKGMKAIESIEEVAEKYKVDIFNIEKSKLFTFMDFMVKYVNSDGITWLKTLGYRMSARDVEFFNDPYGDVSDEDIDYINYVRNTEDEKLGMILQNAVKCKWDEARTQMIKENLEGNIKNIEGSDEPIDLDKINERLQAVKKSFFGQALHSSSNIDEKYKPENVFKGVELALARLKENAPHRKDEIIELTAYSNLKDTYVVEDTTNGKFTYMSESLPVEDFYRKRKFCELDSIEEMLYHFHNMFKEDKKTIEYHINETKEFHYKGFHPFFPFRIRGSIAQGAASYRRKNQDTLEVEATGVIAASRIDKLTEAGHLQTDKTTFEDIKNEFHYTQDIGSNGKALKETVKESTFELVKITGKNRFNQEDIDMIPTIKGKQLFENIDYRSLDEKIDSPLMNKYIDIKTGIIHNSQYLINLRIKLKPGMEEYARNLKLKVKDIFESHFVGKNNETLFYNLIKTENGTELLIENVPADAAKKESISESSILNDVKAKIGGIKQYKEWVDAENPESASFSDPKKLDTKLIDLAKSYSSKMYKHIERLAKSIDEYKGLVDVETNNRFYVDNAKLKMTNAAIINLLLTSQFRILEKNTSIEIGEAQSESERSNKIAYKDSKLVREIEELQGDLKSGRLLLVAALDNIAMFSSGSEALDNYEMRIADMGKTTSYDKTALKNTVTLLEKLLKSHPNRDLLISSVIQANIRFDGRNKDDADKQVRYGIEAPWTPNIISVARTLTDISSDRMYRRRLSNKDRIKHLKSAADTKQDSQIIATVLKDYFNDDVMGDHKAYREQIIENINASLEPGETKYHIYSLNCGDSRPCTACELYLNRPSKDDPTKFVQGVGKIKGNRHYIKEDIIVKELDIADFRKGITECPNYKENSISSIFQITNKDVVIPEINTPYFNKKLEEMLNKKTFQKPS